MMPRKPPPIPGPAVKPAPAKPAPAKPEPAKPEPHQPDPAQPETAQPRPATALSPRPSGEQLERKACPRGCGTEVLLGQDGVTFETSPRWFLEHPHPYRGSHHPYVGFQEDGRTRVVQRNQLWAEHQCMGPAEPNGPAARATRLPAPAIPRSATRGSGHSR